MTVLFTKTSATLPVSEVFGPTFQGEGPSAGRLAAFVRLGGCNLTCRDCDTPYTWDGSRYDLRAELAQVTATQILTQLPPAPLVVISGGEPTLYRASLAMLELLTALRTAGRLVEVETNGTIDPRPMDQFANVTFHVSPKLEGPISDDPASRRLNAPSLWRYAELAQAGRADWKLVVDGIQSARAALALAAAYEVPAGQVWLMPAGTTPEQTMANARAVADFALSSGVNLSLRQHVLLWPNIARGR